MEDEKDEYIRRAMRLAEDMKSLADEGEIQAPDGSCAVLFGVIRDCAYNIQGRAEQEAENHLAIGNWNENREERVRREPSARQEGRVKS